jgi:hypothetical protein
MAITQVNISSPSGETIYTDSNIGSTVDAIKATSASLLWVIVDNSANAATTYIRVWNTASGSVVNGTTPPDLILPIFANKIEVFTFGTAAAPGVTFGTALSAAASTTPATGTTGPSSSVTAQFAYV